MLPTQSLQSKEWRIAGWAEEQCERQDEDEEVAHAQSLRTHKAAKEPPDTAGLLGHGNCGMPGATPTARTTSKQKVNKASAGGATLALEP